MSIEEHDIRLAGEVAASTQMAQTLVPPSGSTVRIKTIIAEGLYTKASEMRVVWDYGNTDEILWVIRGSGRFDEEIIISGADIDGVKELALVCDNGETQALNMAAFMSLTMEIP